MNRQQAVFLLVGLAFGVLTGFGFGKAYFQEPETGLAPGGVAGIPAPAGPMAATQTGGGSPAGQDGAPMVREINALKARLQQNPEDLPALVRLANLYHDASIWEQAADYYQRAIELEPEQPNLLTDLGICYRGLGRFDEALELFDRAHALDAAHWQSLFNKAVVVGFDKGRFEQALETVDRMEAISPRPADLPVESVTRLRGELVRLSQSKAENGGAS